MKRLITAITCFFIFSMSTAQALIVSPREERNILDSISLLCGDTWCEGDFGFEFRSLNCSNKNDFLCHLDFVMISSYSLSELPVQKSRVKPVVHERHSVSCEISNIQSIDQIVENKRTWEINQDFYEKLSLCIQELEKLFNSKINIPPTTMTTKKPKFKS